MTQVSTLGAYSVKLLEALQRGLVRCIGGTVYDSNMNYLMTNTDMYYAVRELGSKGIPVQRIDSGGSPTWDLTRE